jgi:hypothetical protein
VAVVDPLGVWVFDVSVADFSFNNAQLSGGGIPCRSAVFLHRTPPDIPTLSAPAGALLITALGATGAIFVRRSRRARRG